MKSTQVILSTQGAAPAPADFNLNGAGSATLQIYSALLHVYFQELV